MPAIPIIGAVAAVAGAGAAVVSTVNQGRAQEEAQQAQEEANAQAQRQADEQAQAAAMAQAQAATAQTQTATSTRPVDSPPPIDYQELAHSIQALANATSEINLEKQTKPAFDTNQLLLWGGVALVLILILSARR